jgi:penicillin-binding protein 2
VFASVVPANHPQYAVVMMVPQGGQGAQVSGPAVEKIEEAMFGVQGGGADLKAALLPTPPSRLPVISPDGLLPVSYPYPQQWPPAPPTPSAAPAAPGQPAAPAAPIPPTPPATLPSPGPVVAAPGGANGKGQ